MSQADFNLVGVIDDDPSDADLVKLQIEETGVASMLFSNGFHNLKDLIQQTRDAGLDGVVCDHRLRARNYAPFDGAEAVAELVQNQIPSVLISHYTDIDVQTKMRPWRKQIPVLLPKDAVASESIISALAACKAEMRGDVAPSRIAYRTLVRIDNVESDLIDAFVPAWNPDLAVRFPISLFDEKLRPLVRPDARFFARVNIGAETANDLFFDKFEPAPNVEPDDEIF